MRTAVATAALAALLLLATGCSGGEGQDVGTPVGCGLLGKARVVGLLGDDATAVQRGSLDDLREKHQRLTCTNVDPQHSEHYVKVTATYHPRPFQLPRHSCDAGWVFAGSVEKYAPACQEGVGGGKQAQTRLVVRWQPYLVRVTISRLNRDWAGDPELGLAMSRQLARTLGVKEAAGDG
jgi:hypothetical protein